MGEAHPSMTLHQDCDCDPGTAEVYGTLGEAEAAQRRHQEQFLLSGGEHLYWRIHFGDQHLSNGTPDQWR